MLAYTGQRCGQTCPSNAPTLGMQKGGWAVGPRPWLCPLSVSVARNSSVLSVSAVCHPPLGEVAAEDGIFCALAGDIIHPNPPCTCGDNATWFL